MEFSAAIFDLDGTLIDSNSVWEKIDRILLQKLWRIGIHDKRIITIIRQILKAGYVGYDILYNTTVGTPQGGIISPLLSNVYL